MTIAEYLDSINKRYKAGISREHSYRGDFQQLLESILPGILVTNEPARVECGAPDYILTKKSVPVGYIEAKDIGEPLDGKKHKEQFDRYKASLPNLILTDYLDFRFYVDGEPISAISIGEIESGKINPILENFEPFEHLISNFGERIKQTVSSPKKLAEMMAGKARILADVLENALTSDEKTEANTYLKGQLKAFREILIHDIDPKQFADLYAQTIAYGMFTARLHDPTLDTFTRQETAVLIPKTNPFLRKLFQYIAGYDLDNRIVWIVDELADLFRATDIKKLIQSFGNGIESQDPFIHFYETFLAEYDPKLRKSRGVWYTPEPVVNFIVRAVDDILKTEFNLSQGLADTSKTKIKLKVPTDDKRFKAGQKEYEQEVHKVQILDPATGTGTFLAEVVRQIHKGFKGQEGIWSNYVENHLIPRLNGFELLMASYAMAHLKLDMLLSETGFKPKKDQRLKIYLTNSLEEYHPETGTLFAFLSDEANEANHIKRDTPVMVVLGNPPYSVSSSNKGEWIEQLIYDYKKGLNEQNINSLSDDYIKFIRYGQYFIDKNKFGIQAYISNNSFIDGIIHRQMRKNLLKSFDHIFILDLHGSSIKQEKTPDGNIDQNVFDIMPGVSINIFIKTGEKKKNELGEVSHFDLFGDRNHKYNFLNENNITSIQWKKLETRDPSYFFTGKNFDGISKYEEGFKIDDLFHEKGSGIKFRKDSLLVKNNFIPNDVMEMINDINHISNLELRNKYNFNETKDWKIDNKRHLFKSDDNIIPVNYRVFDTRYTYYPLERIDDIIPRGDSRKNLMMNIIKGSIGFICFRQSRNNNIGNFWITKHIVSKDVISSLDSATVFPVYIYPEDNEYINLEGSPTRKPNLNSKIVKKLAHGLKLSFVPERVNEKGIFAPIDLLDYIYAVLHSPTYREKYKEFLKIDFPRVPYPNDQETFWQLVDLGGELRQIHLLEHPSVENFITTYPNDGSNVIERRLTKNSPGFELTEEDHELGRVWINDEQYFEKVPIKAWEFYIGGYQPAQKWLKDRRDKELSFEEIQHYQKIIVALTETDHLMKEIDQIEFD